MEMTILRRYTIVFWKECGPAVFKDESALVREGSFKATEGEKGDSRREAAFGNSTKKSALHLACPGGGQKKRDRPDRK